MTKALASVGIDSHCAGPAGATVAGGAGAEQRIVAALRDRLGADRYDVWFGESVTITVEADAAAGSPVVCLGVATAFSQDWLRRAFGADVEAVVRRVCGQAAVVWRADAAVAQHPTSAQCPGVAVQAGPPAKAAGALAVRPRKADGARATPTGISAVAVPSLPGAREPATAGIRRPQAALETFVVGPSNRMAYAAVELGAGRPGEMSPLVLHGPTGVGKSHLLEGVCRRFRELHPGATTLLLSAEQFTTSFLQSLHGSGLPGFRRACRQADLLAIDDLQFFVGKRATLMELHQTVDSLHRQGRQLVFASDRDLSALDGLGAELVTRLRGGMTARIEPPDYDVRRGIVAAVAAHRGCPLPEDVVHFVATHMTRHARELIGALNRLEATSHMLGLPVSLGMAEEALSDLVRSSGRSVRLADIERAVCAAFGFEAGLLQSARRARTVNHPRMLAMYLARRHTSSALAEIGSYFGRRSHSTVISAQKTVDGWITRRSRIVLADATWDVEEAIRRVEDVLRAG
jgi:chromosomal replication initiator protein